MKIVRFLHSAEPGTPLSEQDLNQTVDVLKALAHPTRLGIVQLLADKRAQGIEDETCCGADEICVCKITEIFDVSMATISHHLRLLRQAGLVEGRREGAWIYYSLRRDDLHGLARTLDHIARLGDD
jgi:ArsR family transcriptional regulator, arsenate/arsenite/antimonite-responsive transcriptional repressor